MVAWYFIDGWISSVKRSLETHSHRIDLLEKQTFRMNSSIERYLESDYLATVLKKVMDESGTVPTKSQLEHLLQEQTLTQKSVQDAFGKIIFIEKEFASQQEKITGLYKTVRILVELQKKKPR